MPLSASEVDPDEPFDPDELLYRRINPSDLNSKGELTPASLNSMSFDATVDGAPSVNRSKFSKPADVIHHDCADGNNVSGWLVYFIEVARLPDKLESADGRTVAFFPKHLPLAACGAHSVVASCLAGDPNFVYLRPSKEIRRELRVMLATRMQPVAHESL